MASAPVWTSEHGIPIRNLWFLLVHAFDCLQLLERAPGDVDGDAELSDMLGQLLAEVVERRLRLGLSRGYVEKSGALARVRGRIDWLATESGQWLLRGKVACRFQDLTHDRPRNQLARAALNAIAARTRKPNLRRRLLDLDRSLASWGVIGDRPSATALLRDVPGRREADDKLMVDVALLALDIVLPSEAEGNTMLTRLSRDEVLLRRIFEAGVAGYLRHHLHRRGGWQVHRQHHREFQVTEESGGMMSALPHMFADIVLERDARLIVIDTKFTSILSPRRHGHGMALKSDHIYQLYTYIRSQEGLSEAANAAEGLLLYPAIGTCMNQAFVIQGHRIRFATIDLGLESAALGPALIEAVCNAPAHQEIAATG